jgi:hypothetical protein
MGFKMTVKWIVIDVLIFVVLLFFVECIFKYLGWNWSTGAFTVGYFVYQVMDHLHPIPGTK